MKQAHGTLLLLALLTTNGLQAANVMIKVRGSDDGTIRRSEIIFYSDKVIQSSKKSDSGDFLDMPLPSKYDVVVCDSNNYLPRRFARGTTPEQNPMTLTLYPVADLRIVIRGSLTSQAGREKTVPLPNVHISLIDKDTRCEIQIATTGPDGTFEKLSVTGTGLRYQFKVGDLVGDQLTKLAFGQYYANLNLDEDRTQLRSPICQIDKHDSSLACKTCKDCPIGSKCFETAGDAPPRECATK